MLGLRLLAPLCLLAGAAAVGNGQGVKAEEKGLPGLTKVTGRASGRGDRKAEGAEKFSLIGTWKGTVKSTVVNWENLGLTIRKRTTFKADGTYQTVLNVDGILATEEGRYWYDRDTDILTMLAKDEDVFVDPGQNPFAMKFEITWANKNEFVMEGGLEKITYRRR
jgi:hypothetical protein